MSEYCGQCGAKLDSNGYCQICRVTRQANIPTPKEPAAWFSGQYRKPVRETFWAREIIGEGIFLLILSVIGFFIYVFNSLDEMGGAQSGGCISSLRLLYFALSGSPLPDT